MDVDPGVKTCGTEAKKRTHVAGSNTSLTTHHTPEHRNKYSIGNVNTHSPPAPEHIKMWYSIRDALYFEISHLRSHVMLVIQNSDA